MTTRVQKQGAWSVWWLCILTCGVYHFVWWNRINKELASATGRDNTLDMWGQWWSQLIPFYNMFGLYKMGVEINKAHAAVGSSVRVSPAVCWFWAPSWFASQTRYMQRRINILGDIQQVQAQHGVAPVGL